MNLSELIPVKLADIELRDIIAVFADWEDIVRYIDHTSYSRSFTPEHKIHAARYQYADAMLKARNASKP
jgi:hypothetical protein